MVKDCYVALTGDVTGVTSDVTCRARRGEQARGRDRRVERKPYMEPYMEPYMVRLKTNINQ